MKALSPVSAAAMQTAIEVFAAIPVLQSEQLAVDFMAAINAGYIRPAQFVAITQAYHACLMDRYEPVAMFMEPSLEQVADLLTDAITCAEVQEQDNEEITL